MKFKVDVTKLRKSDNINNLIITTCKDETMPWVIIFNIAFICSILLFPYIKFVQYIKTILKENLNILSINYI